jgi:hypothetical protein
MNLMKHIEIEHIENGTVVSCRKDNYEVTKQFFPTPKEAREFLLEQLNAEIAHIEKQQIEVTPVPTGGPDESWI